MKNNYYYDIAEDLKDYSDAWCYIIIGGRNTGKTYSALRYHAIDNSINFTFIKRTMDDVDLLCAGSSKKKVCEGGSMDLSPFKSINRDFGSEIYPYQIKKGIGAFYHYNEDGEIGSLPIGYIMSLSGVSKFKGFDLSNSDSIIFDEFIPAPWDRINRKEGEQLMSLYKTISRDREHRGRKPLKLICLANADSIVNPTMEILEITDIVASMQIRDEEVRYLADRGILIRRVKTSKEFEDVEKNSSLYRAMGSTAWGRSAFENEFAYNDFTNVRKINLKNMQPCCSLQHKQKTFYIYCSEDGTYYMTKSRHTLVDEFYNLNLENDQKLFYQEWGKILRNACIEGNMKFETYSMYDIIINYKKMFII